MHERNFKFFMSNNEVERTQSKTKSQSVEPIVEYKGRVLKADKPIRHITQYKCLPTRTVIMSIVDIIKMPPYTQFTSIVTP